tara:strand:+ start:37 stop:399 length:363 start_codon:yes stop_codon:yes gene_type:complete
MGPNIENNKNINLRKSSEDRLEPTMISEPPIQRRITAIVTPIVSMMGEDIRRNFDDLNNRLKYSQDSLLKRLDSYFSTANAFNILIDEKFSVIMLKIPPICLVFRLAFLLILLPIMWITN